jgi:hypothetical protein
LRNVSKLDPGWCVIAHLFAPPNLTVDAGSSKTLRQWMTDQQMIDAKALIILEHAGAATDIKKVPQFRLVPSCFQQKGGRSFPLARPDSQLGSLSRR